MVTPPAEIATLLSYSNETLDRRSNSSINQTPHVNVARRWYVSAMEIPAMTHGTVDQGDSICGPKKKLQGSAKIQTRSTIPDLTGRLRADGTGLCCFGLLKGPPT